MTDMRETRLPSQGGSTTIDKKGKATAAGGTLGPRDPNHPDMKAKAARRLAAEGDK